MRPETLAAAIMIVAFALLLQWIATPLPPTPADPCPTCCHTYQECDADQRARACRTPAECDAVDDRDHREELHR